MKIWDVITYQGRSFNGGLVTPRDVSVWMNNYIQLKSVRKWDQLFEIDNTNSPLWSYHFYTNCVIFQL